MQMADRISAKSARTLKNTASPYTLADTADTPLGLRKETARTRSACKRNAKPETRGEIPAFLFVRERSLHANPHPAPPDPPPRLCGTHLPIFYQPPNECQEQTQNLPPALRIFLRAYLSSVKRRGASPTHKGELMFAARRPGSQYSPKGTGRYQYSRWWGDLDLNQGPPRYKLGALTD